MSLSDYLSSKYSSIVTHLAYDATKLSFIVSEAVRAYPASSESECTDIDKLYYFGKVTFLQMALDDLAVNVMYNSVNQKAAVDRKAIYNQVAGLLEKTIAEGSKYSVQAGIRVGKIVHKNDPFDLNSYKDFYSV